MNLFRLDVSRDTGAAMLWMSTEDTPCGFKPILVWPSVEDGKEFALMLLDICQQRIDEEKDLADIDSNLKGRIKESPIQSEKYDRLKSGPRSRSQPRKHSDN